MFAWVVLASVVISAIGCRGTSGVEKKVDATLRRYTKSGGQAYAEGHVEVAVKEYRNAIRRAWAIDDPYESGTNAYNLAACLTSLSRSAEARDWLLDARAELHRARASTGNTWLLEAKIAQQEFRLEDVPMLVQQACCVDPPCAETGCGGSCGPRDPCDDGCIAKIPCVGSKIAERKAAKQCRDAFQAQIELARARFAAEQYDIPMALQHFDRACNLAKGVCGYELQAELQNVAALIHIAKGEYLQAARHLDREADNLRLAGNYREIPASLRLASAAYEQAGLTALAADRLSRVARVLFGRGETERAWRCIQTAIALAEIACSESTKVRLALLANEIVQTLDEDGGTIPEPSEAELQMLAPDNDALPPNANSSGDLIP